MQTAGLLDLDRRVTDPKDFLDPPDRFLQDELLVLHVPDPQMAAQRVHP